MTSIISRQQGDSSTQVITQPVRQTSPLSFAQQRLWFLNQLDPNNPCYNVATAVRLVGTLHYPALEQSLNEILRRHQALRSSFPTQAGKPVQVIAPSLSLSLPVVDLRELPETEREAKAQLLAAEEAQKPFDLANGALLRVSLLQLNDEEHVLLVIWHQIVADTESLGVFFEELGTLYEAFCAGKLSSLPELSIQSLDFIDRQPQPEVLETGLAYWKQKLDGAPPLLQLPLDRPRPQVQTFNGATRQLILPQSLSEALKILSQREGVTLFTLLLAAFKTLLYRHTGQDDILVGTTVANRNQPETEKLIGLFANTLVLRTDLSENPSFQTLLSRVQAGTEAAFAHQDLPFEQLVEELQLERNMSYTPLFQVMFQLSERNQLIPQLSSLQVENFQFDQQVVQFDLTLNIVETQTLNCWFNYNTDLFDATTIERLSGHFQMLLEGIVATPEQGLLNLPLLTEAEQRQILVGWNNTQLEYSKEQCIHQLIAAQAERTPEAIALIFEDQQLTYRELNTRANQLGHYLQQLGIEPEVRVGICMERSPEMVVGILGILKAGGTYVPIDPKYPKDRLTFMLEDTQLPVLVMQQQLIDALPEHNARVICLDTDWEIIAQQSVENPVSGVSVENLAYVMFTSGSTGRPKGVKVTHASLRHYVHSVNNELQITAKDVYLHTASFSFASSIRQSMIALSQGATVLIATHEQIRSPLTIYELIQQRGITVCDNVPSFWRYGLQALESIAAEKRKALLKSNLRLIVFCGELLTWEIPQAIHREFEHPPRMANFYAMTETTSVSLYHLPSKFDSETGPVPVGRPVVNVQTYILNPQLKPVPIGVPGELHVGGPGLSQGYFNRPELTEQKFIPNPFTDNSADLLHKTGDLARYLPDGTIEILGRIDDQVQLRGIRIELGEIEATLSQHPAVRTAVVIAREDVPGEKRVVAYVIPNSEQTLTTSELRSYLREQLPEYMVPAAFVFLDALPLNANRKVNRRALPAPDPTRIESETTLVAPRDQLELQLTKIWEEVLGIQPIGIRDNFFDLGGHSLLVMRIIAQIEKLTGQALPLATFFQAPTIEQLANLLRQESSAPWRSLVTIQPNGSKPPFFCIHAVGGNVLFYQRFVRYLPDQPLYGLQAQGLDGKQAPCTSVEEMAAHYIKEIQTVQPQGPYFLGGLSFGGLVAFEIARQLEAQGQKVALLTLLDTRGRAYRKRQRFHQVFYHLKKFLEKGPKHILERVKAKPKGSQDRVKAKLPKIARALRLHGEKNVPESLKQVIAANLQATEDYLPKRYSGRVHLFRAIQPEEQGWDIDPQLGWGKLAAQGVQIYDIPSSHHEMFEEPHIQVLAEKLKTCLEQASAEE